MPATELEALARRFVAGVLNGRNLPAIQTLAHPDYVDHSAPARSDSGLDSVYAFLRLWRAAFPDLRLTVAHCSGGESLVVVRPVSAGMHRGRSWACRRRRWAKRCPTRAIGASSPRCCASISASSSRRTKRSKRRPTREVGRPPRDVRTPAAAARGARPAHGRAQYRKEEPWPARRRSCWSTTTR